MASHAQSDHAETRERILRSSERLFSEKGYDGTSIRDITAEAECNVAAVNYHFGGKDNLYVETFRRLLIDLRDRRISSMRRDMSNVADPTLEHFLESFVNAFLEPLVDGSRGRLLLSFFANEMTGAHLPPGLFLDEFIRPMVLVTTEGLDRTGPPLDPMTARMCMMSIVGQLLHTLKALPYFSNPEGPHMVPTNLGDHIQHVVRFSAGGIRACAATEEAP
ncbi:MAG: CerR family C-terminal domain-containing protein [Thermoanaerobaculales bacterium]|nr:CerR family C-terminal domain-containing protein [Thermoanaerobaculales bacterium]